MKIKATYRPLSTTGSGLLFGGKCRFGFNGMEKNNEVYGEGNEYTTEFRQYDPRIGRWWSVDPKAAEQPNQSPYKFGLNNPIIYNDPEGGTEFLTINITDERTGKTTSITYIKSDEVFYGRQECHYVDGVHYDHIYHDRQTTLNVSIDKNGNLNYTGGSTRLITERIAYSTSIKSDLYANTKFSLKGKGGYQVGGIYMTSKEGGSDPTKFKSLTSSREMKDADGLINALGGLKGDVGQIGTKFGTLKNIIGRLNDVIYSGNKFRETVEEIVNVNSKPEKTTDSIPIVGDVTGKFHGYGTYDDPNVDTLWHNDQAQQGTYPDEDKEKK